MGSIENDTTSWKAAGGAGLRVPLGLNLWIRGTGMEFGKDQLEKPLSLGTMNETTLWEICCEKDATFCRSKAAAYNHRSDH